MKKPPTNAARVRDWLAVNATEDDGRTFAEIREALGFTTRQLNGVTCVELRRGTITSSGTRNSKRYWRSDDPAKLAEFTEWERRTSAENRRRLGIPTRDELNTRLAAQKAERIASDEANRRAREIVRKMAAEERAAKRLAEREEKKAAASKAKVVQVKRQKRSAKKVGAVLQAFAKHAEAKAAVTPEPKPKPKPETVEQWMKRTGKKPETIPVGVVCEREQLKGHRALNVGSWYGRNWA